mgnify:CR=1 FL=1
MLTVTLGGTIMYGIYRTMTMLDVEEESVVSTYYSLPCHDNNLQEETFLINVKNLNSPIFFNMNIYICI